MLKFLSRNSIAIDVVILAFISLFLISFFSPSLLLLKSTINGGDTGSHYPSADYLKNVLLPKGKIMGWDQGNYAGYPLFYHYFPLPFLLMAFLSILVPLEIAFKLIAVLGTFLLPFAIYFAFRALKYEFPVPIIAAVFSLAFLFNQGNSMWGANIPSTLAGEFCYSLGFAFVFLFMGTLFCGVKEKKYVIINAVLIFLIGMSHVYTLIFCVILATFFIFDNYRENFKYLLLVYGLGGMLLAFWFLGVIIDTPYTTSFAFRWTISSIFEVFPPIVIPFMALSTVAFFYNRKDKRTWYFLYAVVACVFVYLLGPRIGVLDIRFVPIFQFLMIVFGATVIMRFISQIKLPIVLPLLIFLVVAIWSDVNATYVRGWINWNFKGYEQKNTWKIFYGINDFLKHSGPGRVEWEHTPLDEALGSIRSSETLPYFARRQTLEGIHMLGAISAPFVFYLESETSYQACNPIQDYFYSTFDLKRGIHHLKLFNTSQFVVRSDQVKAAIKNYPEFELQKSVGEYQIYKLLSNDNQYVIPLENKPVLFSTSCWRDISYQWFARDDLQNVFLAFKNNTDDLDKKLFSYQASDLSVVKSESYDKTPIKVFSQVNDESIDIETSTPGRPLLIKVSYHPNWKVTGADRIYPVSPSFMLVFPTQNKVHLSFEPSPIENFGKILSLLGLLLIISTPLWCKGRANSNSGQLEHESRKWMVILVGAMAILLLSFSLDILYPTSEALLKKGRAQFDRNNYQAARELLQRSMDHSKISSGFHYEAQLFYATSFVRENRFFEAANELRKFTQQYPRTFWSPQAYFDLAYCETNLGRKNMALDIYNKIIADFPTTTWATYSKDRIKELEAKK